MPENITMQNLTELLMQGNTFNQNTCQALAIITNNHVNQMNQFGWFLVTITISIIIILIIVFSKNHLQNDLKNEGEKSETTTTTKIY